MLKKIAITVLGLGLLVAVSCSKFATYISKRDLVIDASFNALKAGESFDKLLSLPTEPIRLKIQEVGGSNVELEKLQADSVRLIIPDTAKWSFSDIQSIEIFLEGASMGTLPANATGKSIKLTLPPAPINLKSKFLSANNPTLDTRVKLVAKNAIAGSAVSLVVSCSFELALKLPK